MFVKSPRARSRKVTFCSTSGSLGITVNTVVLEREREK